MGTVYDAGRYFSDMDGFAGALVREARRPSSRRPTQRRARRVSLALALSRLEREHVALLLAICELEGPASPTDANSQALRDALLPMLREDLRQTQHALALASRGLYGSCEECHKPFTARQLELKPAITRCPVCEARARRGTLD